MANLELAVVNGSSSKAESRSHLYNRSHEHAHNQHVVAVGGRGGSKVEDIRRDEWSNEGINVLLDVYEAKWNQRNRGNLKGGDWDDVATRVSARCGGGRMPKTPFQCKNKVASMKQKYRSEALLKGITGSTSSRWPFYTRLDAMLRIPTKEDEDEDDEDEEDEEEEEAVAHVHLPRSALLVESGDSQHEEALRREHKVLGSKQDRLGLGGLLHQSPYGFHRVDDAANTHVPPNTRTPPQRSLGGGGGGAHESDSHASRSKAGGGGAVLGTPDSSNKDQLSTRDVAASICAFAHSILRLEEAKMVMYKDSERLRAEMESRRVDMELKRTEVIMSTQLEIAKLLSGNLTGNPRKRKASKPLRRRALKEKPPSPPNLTISSNPLREKPSSPVKAHPAENSHPVSNATHLNSPRNTQAMNDVPSVHISPSLPQPSIVSAQQSLHSPHVALALSASQSCSQHCRSIPAEKGLQGC